MRPLVLTLAVISVIALAARTAEAQYGRSGGGAYRGYYEYRGYHEYSGYDGRGSRGAYYAPSRSYGRSHYQPSYRRYGSSQSYFPLSHAQAARRIMADYSRYRYSPHPRSLYKSPPVRYGRWGW